MDGSPPEKERGDPLLLPHAVRDRLLEFVDGDTLLTCRLVCQHWQEEITNRGELWRRRCQWAGVHEDETKPHPKINFFRRYINAKRVLRQMRSGESWRINNDCDGSDCLFHGHRDNPFLDICQHSQPSYNITHPQLLSVCKQLLDSNHNGFFVCTIDDQLIVINLLERKVMWRTENHETYIWERRGHLIVTITHSGSIKIYSLGGKCEQESEPESRLKGARQMSVHPTAPAIVVKAENCNFFLVDEELRVFPVRPLFPHLIEQQAVGEHAGREKIKRMFFIKPTSGQSDNHLSLVLEGSSSVTCAIITKSGVLLHYVLLWHKEILSFASGQSWLKYVYVNEGHVVAHAIHFMSDKINVQLLWKKALPAQLPACPHIMVTAGTCFLLAFVRNSLRVYQLNGGTCVAELPGVLIMDRTLCFGFQRHGYDRDQLNSIVCFIQCVEAHIKGISPTVRQAQMLYFINVMWLDGLSLAATRQDIPVAMLFSSETEKGKCLRWSGGLWQDHSKV